MRTNAKRLLTGPSSNLAVGRLSPSKFEILKPVYMKTYLEVPFSDKDKVKAMGARFDMSRKLWFVPDGIDNHPFRRWIPYNETAAKIDRIRKQLARKRRERGETGISG